MRKNIAEKFRISKKISGNKEKEEEHRVADG
jgi:hypothetical protein